MPMGLFCPNIQWFPRIWHIKCTFLSMKFQASQNKIVVYFSSFISYYFSYLHSALQSINYLTLAQPSGITVIIKIDSESHPRVSMPLQSPSCIDTGLGHVTGFGQWDISKCTEAEAFKESPCALGFVLLEHCCHQVTKSSLAFLRVKEQAVPAPSNPSAEAS